MRYRQVRDNAIMNAAQVHLWTMTPEITVSVDMSNYAPTVPQIQQTRTFTEQNHDTHVATQAPRTVLHERTSTVLSDNRRPKCE